MQGFYRANLRNLWKSAFEKLDNYLWIVLTWHRVSSKCLRLVTQLLILVNSDKHIPLQR